MSTEDVLLTALTLVQDIEPCEFVAELDVDRTPPQWRIGYGTAYILGQPVTKGATCTLEQAETWLRADLEVALANVRRLVTCDVTDDQMAALTALCADIGYQDFSQSSVLEAVNLALPSVAADRFLEYSNDVHPNIIRTTRRWHERLAFLANMGGPTTKITPPWEEPNG